MTICESMKDAVRKRLREHKSLYDIGMELCIGVEEPRRKALRVVKDVLEDDKLDTERYLRDNADWLGYNTDRLAGGIARGEQIRAAKNCGIKASVATPKASEASKSFSSVTVLPGRFTKETSETSRYESQNVQNRKCSNSTDLIDYPTKDVSDKTMRNESKPIDIIMQLSEQIKEEIEDLNRLKGLVKKKEETIKDMEKNLEKMKKELDAKSKKEESPQKDLSLFGLLAKKIWKR